MLIGAGLACAAVYLAWLAAPTAALAAPVRTACPDRWGTVRAASPPFMRAT